MENQESLWYACSGDAPEPTAPRRAPARRPKGKLPVWGIALIIVAVAVVIIGSCLLFRGGAGMDPTAPGAADELPRDYKSFFENYFTANEETKECTIPTVQTAKRVTLTLSPAGEAPLTAQEIYEHCAPSIVAVSAFPDETSDESYFWGSGVILTEDGYILTNSHVVEGACRARITLWDDTEYDALLVGYDPRTDIAVLKVSAHGLTAATFASADSLLVGDAVYAIGNPLGKEFRSTMTEGIISGINRDISYNGVTNSLLQTSAPINEGNSGGALINVYGQVVGITNMKMSSRYIGSVSIEGVAFAIPSGTVKTIADSLLESGEVRGRPALGVTVGKVPQTAVEEYNLPAGLYVSAVSENSDCAAKGIAAGDVLLAANGVELSVNEDLTGIIADLSVGDELTLTVWHDGETREVTVKLADVNDVY